MGLLDKIKNALFEVEYVEVEEPKKTPKKVKEKKEEKPIAKKIVLPGKREEKIEELHEEELKDEDFEIRPKNETVKEKAHEEFKFMDDNDFKVEEDREEPEILQVLDENEEIPIKEGKHAGVVVEEEKVEVIENKPEPVEDYYTAPTSRESKPYGLDHSYNVSVHPYGTYEKKEEKNYFRPSPIISPIYGILDKNYKKEDVKEKKEVRISSSYSRSNLNVDDIRNKAYGEKKVEQPPIKEEEDNSKFDVEEEEEDNLLVDLSDRAKPEVKEITMGDALEYFQDLGLEYNVDYMDASKEKSVPKKSIEQPVEEAVMAEELENATSSLDEDKKVVEKKPQTREELSVKKDTIEDDNDNLFDLIDSMYQEKD